MPDPPLELGCVIRVGTARIFVTLIDLPTVEGYNVNTGAKWSGVQGDIARVVALHYRRYVNDRATSAHMGAYFVDKVVQDEKGRTAICTGYTNTPVPTWTGIRLRGGPWSTIVKPSVVAEDFGVYTTQRVLAAGEGREHTRPARDHKVTRPTKPQS